MKKIVFGLLFLIFDCIISIGRNIDFIPDGNIIMGHFNINLIPDFIGYLLIYMGFLQIYKKEEGLSKSMPILRGLIGYSTVVYFLDFIGALNGLQTVSYFIHIVNTIGVLYAIYSIVDLTHELEKEYHKEFHSTFLSKNWLIILGLDVLIELFGFVDLIPHLLAICVIADFIAMIVFIICFIDVVYLYKKVARSFVVNKMIK